MAGEEGQGGLGVGQDPDRPGAADLEVVGVAQLTQHHRHPRQGLVEGQPVGQSTSAAISRQAGIRQGRTSTWREASAFSSSATARSGSSCSRTSSTTRRMNERVSFPPPRRAWSTSWAASWDRSRVCSAMNRPSGRQAQLLDVLVDPRQPTGQLQGVAHQHLGGLALPAQHGGQLGGCELRHQRRTLTGQRDQLLPEHPPRGVPLVGGRMHQRPLPRRRQQVRVGPHPRRHRRPRRPQHPGPGIERRGRHTDNPTIDHRHSNRPEPLIHKGFGNSRSTVSPLPPDGFEARSRATSTSDQRPRPANRRTLDQRTGAPQPPGYLSSLVSLVEGAPVRWSRVRRFAGRGRWSLVEVPSGASLETKIGR